MGNLPTEHSTNEDRPNEGRPNEDRPHKDIDAFLTERMPGFSPRASQQQMTSLIAESIFSEQNALIEAGTGTGKTFAYLLPVLSSDKKVIISTGTKNLQDQLYFQDLPFINESFGRTTALLKGRANYLCRERLLREFNERQSNELVGETLVTIFEWSESTKTGDLTELLDDEGLSNVQRQVTSTADTCLGADCAHYENCFVYQARQRALAADVVVVNHHLFFADLSLKEDDLGALLPQADVLVIDEAHQIEEIARVFYGQRVSSAQLIDLVSDVVREQRILGMDDPELMDAGEALTTLVQQMSQSIREQELATIETVIRLPIIEDLDLAMADLISRLEIAAPRSVNMARCYSRACQLNDMFTMLTEETDNHEAAHWLELTHRGFVIHLLPLDIATYLKPLFEDAARTWLLVSATLATTAAHDVDPKEPVSDKTFRHIREALGFEQGIEARFASPFNYADQVVGWVPNITDPTDASHTQQLVASVLPLLRSHTGRSLLLFTSHKALTIATEYLALHYDLAVMAQGQIAKSRLIDKFRQTEGAVLLATHSFWQGVDLSGSDLKLLVIDKLPFTSPDDPIFQARLKVIEHSGGNSFAELALQKAAVTLKQGFGRLVRQESDRGVFVLGDPRINARSYGKVLKKCLPGFPWQDDAAAVQEYLESLP